MYGRRYDAPVLASAGVPGSPFAPACPACGAAVPADEVWCPACGAWPDEPPIADRAFLSVDLDVPAGTSAVAAAGITARAGTRPPTERADRRAADGAVSFPTLDASRERMRAVYGFADFRLGQAEVLTHLMTSDVLGVMPTGAGKTLCYVLPALAVQRTVVVSPLIALMQDQVEALQTLGVPATFINSTLSRDEQNRRFVDFTRDRYALLYVAPERFANVRFVDRLRTHGVRLLVIDEAHCISEWGHDFRPDYLTLGDTRRRLGAPRTLALTATADGQVRADILQRLGIADRAQEVVTNFDRPNLHYAVVPVADERARLDWLVPYVRARGGQAGIIYARTRRAVDETTAALIGAGVRAVAYHAGMDTEQRATAQRQFLTGRVPVIVATNAFGMGIDKPDVRYVVHLHLPGRLEAYYQEAGRAGRDGDPAACTLLYATRDRALQRRFIDQAHPDEAQLRTLWRMLVALQQAAGDRALFTAEASDEARTHDLDGALPIALGAFRASGLLASGSLRVQTLDPEAPLDPAYVEQRRRYAEARLAQMVEYAETPACRRALILRYFGQQAPATCGHCDRCEGTAIASDAEAYPDSLFDALLAVRDEIASETNRAPYMVFEERTARELATYRPESLAALRATWGLGERRVEWFGDRLLRTIASWEHTHLEAPPAPPRPVTATASGTSLTRAAGEPEVAFDNETFQRLREWRLARARSEGVPPYTVFNDRTARALAAARPTSEEALREVWGLGESRIRAFGAELLAILREAS